MLRSNSLLHPQNLFNLSLPKEIMKKAVILILLGIFLISLASAFYAEPSLILQKTTFQPGETLLGRIEGNFVQKISPTQIKFYEGRREIFVDFDILYYNGTYYLYAYMEREGNFSINISNILYKDVNLKSKTLSSSLKVTRQENNTQILAIKPGFVYTSSQPELIVSNKGNSPLNLSFEKQQITISPLEAKTISPSKIEGVSFAKIETYEVFEVPIIYFSLYPPNETQNQTQNQTNQTNATLTSGFRMFPSSFILNSTEGKQILTKLRISNLGNNKISELSISSNISVVTIEKLDKLVPNSSKELNLTFISNIPGIFKGEILISYKEEGLLGVSKRSIPFEFLVFPKNISVYVETKGKKCSEFGGKICVNQKCIGNYTFTSYGEYCCLGSCEEIKAASQGGNYRWIASLFIFVFLGIVGYFAWKKYKKTKAPAPGQVLEKKTKLFEKRVHGGVSRT